MEKWDILNADGTPTGKTALRGKCNLKPGEYHLVVHIWVVSSKGNLLIQRRSERRRLMPGEWAATGGSAVSGENSAAAAARELYEELGIKAPEGGLRYVTRMKRRNSMLDIYFVRCDADAMGLRLQRNEVAEVKWVTPDELRYMIDNREYHTYGKEYFKVVFDYLEKLKATEEEKA